jgi:hypothetical protein
MFHKLPYEIDSYTQNPIFLFPIVLPSKRICNFETIQNEEYNSGQMFT